MQVLFSLIINIIASLIQIVVYPINSLITSILPDFSNKIMEVSTNIESLFSGMVWALGVIPAPVIVTLTFIISVEILRHTIFMSTHVITLIINLIKRLKFW